MSRAVKWVCDLPEVVRWFITGIVIPVTVWFLAIRSDVNALQIKHDETEKKISVIKETQKQNDRLIIDKLEEVQRSLGRLEGEIKRIK